MNSNANLKLSRWCVAGAWFFMLTSGLILCACPGWPAMGAGLAGAALWLRKGVDLVTPAAALAGCLLVTGFEGFALVQEHKHRNQILLRLKQRQAAEHAVVATNSLPRLITP